METLYGVLALVFLILALLTAILSVVGKIRFYGGLMATALTLIVSNVWMILRANLLLGRNAINYVMDMTFDAVRQTVMEIPMFAELSGQLAESPEEAQQILSLFLDQLKTAYLALFPVMLILCSLVMSYVCCMLIKLMVYSWRKKECGMPPFSEMRVNRVTVLVLAVSFLLTQVLPLSAGVVALNIFGVLFFITVFAGFSMIDFWMKLWLRNGVLRFILYAVVLCVSYFFSGFITLALTGIGILDAFCDYRSRVVN